MPLSRTAPPLGARLTIHINREAMYLNGVDDCWKHKPRMASAITLKFITLTAILEHVCDIWMEDNGQNDQTTGSQTSVSKKNT
jgi:hypothetical protein